MNKQQKDTSSFHYVRVDFILRPKDGTRVSDLFAWRVILGPMIRHFKLEDRWIKTTFNLIEGTIHVQVSIRTTKPNEEVIQTVTRLLEKDNEITWN